MNRNESSEWADAMRGHINARRLDLTDMAYWRRGFLSQRRQFPWTCDGVRGRHPYQSARSRAMQHVRLPA